MGVIIETCLLLVECLKENREGEGFYFLVSLTIQNKRKKLLLLTLFSLAPVFFLEEQRKKRLSSGLALRLNIKLSPSLSLILSKAEYQNLLCGCQWI